MNLQPTLESALVCIRPMVKEDFEELYRIASDSLIWEQHQNSDRYTLEKFRLFFDQGIAGKSAFTISDKNTNQIIGSSRYKVINEEEGVIEIGWSFLARSFWGGNYNKAFKKLMVNYALNSYKKVVFYVHLNNYRSQKAMKKLGGRIWKEGSAIWIRPSAETLTYVLEQPLV